MSITIKNEQFNQKLEDNKNASIFAKQIAAKLSDKFPEVTMDIETSSVSYTISETNKTETIEKLEKISFNYKNIPLAILKTALGFGKVALRWENPTNWRIADSHRTFDNDTMKKLVASGARYIKNNLPDAKKNAIRETESQKEYKKVKKLLKKQGFKAEIDKHGHGVNFSGHGLKDETVFRTSSTLDMEIPLDKLAEVMKVLNK